MKYRSLFFSRTGKNFNKNSLINFNSKFFSSNFSTLNTISPLDGRYAVSVENLKNYYSEGALIKYRTIVEVEWVKFLITSVFSENDLKTKYKISSQELRDIIIKLDSIIREFDLHSSEKVKEIENKINHDVKAVEYYLKGEMRKKEINESLYEIVHFCCTSEDINNLAWGLIIKDSVNLVFHPQMNKLIHTITGLAEEYHNVPMMSKTHGQPATPTTLGKEIANYAYRINEQHYRLKQKKVKGKLNGAVGNFNAHYAVLPHINWMQVSNTFIKNLGLEWNPYTTQIENHDSICEIFNNISLLNTIMIGLCRDFWGYISLNYFTQKVKKEEVGSSTMPHKVNPIDFENSEGNLGISNSLFDFMSSKLPISRFQRDLSDSTVLRNIGTAMGYSVLAYKSLEKGLSKLQVNKNVIETDLNNHWELLAEPLQTVMRYHGYQNPYELLKDLTRGKSLTQSEYLEFVNNLKLPPDVKDYLKNLTPATYTGNASFMSKNIREFLK